MKFGIAIFAALVAFLSPSGDAVSETDEITVSDPKVATRTYELRRTLQDAKLEEIGFNKTTEFSVDTDENGQRRNKRVIRYLVKDECSKAKEWQEKLESRLPKNFFSSTASFTFSRDVQDRVNGRKTKYCLIGIELVTKTPLSAGMRRRRRSFWSWLRIKIDIRIRIEMKLKAKIKYQRKVQNIPLPTPAFSLY